MNTPRTRKPSRFSQDAWLKTFEKAGSGAGQFSLAISNTEVALAFANFVSSFTHLEMSVARFLARIMDAEDEIATHVLSAIVSANAKISLMRAVLERARHNADKPESFDQIIDEFKSLNGLRNDECMLATKRMLAMERCAGQNRGQIHTF